MGNKNSNDCDSNADDGNKEVCYSPADLFTLLVHATSKSAPLVPTREV
jgi:hypothetical protein